VRGDLGPKPEEKRKGGLRQLSDSTGGKRERVIRLSLKKKIDACTKAKERGEGGGQAVCQALYPWNAWERKIDKERGASYEV